MKHLRTEEIYDAALDAEAFENLAATLASALGARSGVMHWQDHHGTKGEVAQTRYFSPDQMEAYDRDFAGSDLWSQAVRLPGMWGRAWDCDELVPSAVYENSRIYNDWVRPAADDTYHCIGAVVRTDWGVGEVGFHRGKSQGKFETGAAEFLTSQLQHLERMFSIRARLNATSEKQGLATAALDVFGHGVILTDPNGRVLHANAAAEEMLGREDGLKTVRGQLAARFTRDESSLKEAISRANDEGVCSGSTVLINRPDGSCYCLTVASVSVPEIGRRNIILVSDHKNSSPGLETRLRDLYQLTASEADLAVSLARGNAPADVAAERGTSVGTVRSQLKSVAAKLGCSRQTEIVARIGDLPKLHL